MTPDDLMRRSSLLYGEDWQSPLARRVRVDARTVRRWKAGDREIPEWLDAFLDLLERHPDER
jgi:DNA-binding transcriptional regulator YiaG